MKNPCSLEIYLPIYFFSSFLETSFEHLLDTEGTKVNQA